MVKSKELFLGKDITCLRGGRVIFQNISFKLNCGDILHLVGENGCGKTSLLRIMAGALDPYEGELFWKGKNFLENGVESHNDNFSFLPSSDSNLKPLENVLENLEFWAGIYGVDKSLCVKSMRKVHITPLKDKEIRYLSAGQKRRVSLARIFLRYTPLWLLDEPLNGLDSKSRDLFLKSIEDYAAKGGIAVVASHYDINSTKILKIKGAV